MFVQHFGPIVLVLSPLVVLVGRARWQVGAHTVAQAVVATVVATVLAVVITVVTLSGASLSPSCFPLRPHSPA